MQVKGLTGSTVAKVRRSVEAAGLLVPLGLSSKSPRLGINTNNHNTCRYFEKLTCSIRSLGLFLPLPLLRPLAGTTVFGMRKCIKILFLQSQNDELTCFLQHQI